VVTLEGILVVKSSNSLTFKIRLQYLDGVNGRGEQKISKNYARKKPKTINIKRVQRDLNARWEHAFGNV
jgi:hypothetical protein